MDQDYSRSFSTFKTASVTNSSFLPETIYDSLNPPPSLIKTTKEILTRNKVGFFKRSLIIVKSDHSFEIGFKKSESIKDYEVVNITFYINNKTNKD